MGFLRKTSVSLDIKQTVISLWFRIPASAAAAVLARDTGIYNGFPVMIGTIPLITFGTQQSGDILSVVAVNAGDCPPGFPNYGSDVGSVDSFPEPPTFIGVQFLPSGVGGADDSYGYLTLNIATANTSLMSSIQEISPSGTCNLLPSPEFTFDTFDASSNLENSHENFGNSFLAGPHVTTDEWHHILLSWDIGSECSAVGGDTPSVDTDSQMWCAFDAVNKNESNLPGGCWIGDKDGTGLGDPNSIFSNNAALAIGFAERETGTPSSSSTFSSDLPCDTIWIPGPPTVTRGSSPTGDTETIAPVQLVEMAECLVFTGVTLDTSDADNVAAFVTAGGTPADPGLSRALLGQAPDIEFRKRSDWIAGVNRGTLGTFAKVGTINPYSGIPSL